MLWSRENLSQCLLALCPKPRSSGLDEFDTVQILSVLTGRLRSKAGEVVRGEVLKKAVETVKRKDSIQYVVTEELVEAYCGDIISEVDMDREMRLSQRIVDELLSIYM